MQEHKGIIFDIERDSYVDGPGIRTTVFFKGCNLKCKWCHNPESQSFAKEILFYKNKCTGCGRCKNLTVDDESFICFNDSKEICGKEYTVDDVLKVILKDKKYYQNSGGGVTFSGGECMLQINFLEELLKKCKENGIHTAVDTAGNVAWELFERVIPYTDMFLFDVKIMDNDLHKEYTGAENTLILENLKKILQSEIPVWIRVPIIPGVNDTTKEMLSIKAFLNQNGFPEKLELLPYHAMGEHKYEALGKEIYKFSAPDKTTINMLKSIIIPN